MLAAPPRRARLDPWSRQQPATSRPTPTTSPKAAAISASTGKPQRVPLSVPTSVLVLSWGGGMVLAWADDTTTSGPLVVVGASHFEMVSGGASTGGGVEVGGGGGGVLTQKMEPPTGMAAPSSPA
eukprot:scaffold281756_cov30-Tisochrysis_lutea.AAC.1